MHPAAIALVVGAAVAHAGWNLCAKQVPGGGALFVWLAAVFSALFQLPLAIGTVVANGGSVPGVWWLALLVSGMIHTGYFVILQRGYAVGDLSVVYPLARGTGPMLSVIAAVWLLDERPGLAALAGTAAVVLGVWVIGGLGSSGSSSWAAGVGYGLVCGVTIAAYTLWDAHAVTTLAVPPLILMAGSALTETVLLGPYALAHRGELGDLWRAHRTPILAVAVLSPVAYVLVLFALRHAPVSLVAPARELSIVIGSVGAWLLLGEPNAPRRLTGAVIVLAGVAAIAAG
ncbi:MAG: EamA family transporter [Actinophytocola sp.]|uniref:EamA family transporter n=1 Tax=Actinophytocola sp. TaxID=1872138 RepID=UPI0013233EB2|nr:EamA family transporter [Actinophytocola sp.]MPZ81227.1 EamA family transporter [Actinophytocola sp.]